MIHEDVGDADTVERVVQFMLTGEYSEYDKHNGSMVNNSSNGMIRESKISFFNVEK